MYTNEEIDVLTRVTGINHSLEELIEEVNKLNIYAMTIVARKDPKNLTKEMIFSLLQYGIDVRGVNKNPKGEVPECLKDICKKDPKIKADKRKEDIPKNIKDIQPSASEVPPTGKVTGNIVHDDLKKRGVIFVRCNKAPDIEERVVDELIQAANDRDIMIQEFIVNEQDGVNKLKAWMESGVIDYIIMNDLGEYSQAKIAQFFFVDDAYRRGIKILLKANDFNPIFPF